MSQAQKDSCRFWTSQECSADIWTATPNDHFYLFYQNLFCFLSFQKVREQAWSLFFGHKPRKLYFFKNQFIHTSFLFCSVWLGLSMNASISDYNRRGPKISGLVTAVLKQTECPTRSLISVTWSAFMLSASSRSREHSIMLGFFSSYKPSPRMASFNIVRI